MGWSGSPSLRKWHWSRNPQEGKQQAKRGRTFPAREQLSANVRNVPGLSEDWERLLWDQSRTSSQGLIWKEWKRTARPQITACAWKLSFWVQIIWFHINAASITILVMTNRTLLLSLKQQELVKRQHWPPISV